MSSARSIEPTQIVFLTSLFLDHLCWVRDPIQILELAFSTVSAPLLRLRAEPFLPCSRLCAVAAQQRIPARCHHSAIPPGCYLAAKGAVPGWLTLEEAHLLFLFICAFFSIDQVPSPASSCLRSFSQR